LKRVHKTKVVYVASMDDQVVPLYSGLFTSLSHPLVLRALYIDGDLAASQYVSLRSYTHQTNRPNWARSSSDFLLKLLVLLLRILNAGLSDSGLLAHLSEVTVGSLSGGETIPLPFFYGLAR
jgi:hypothetical protein